MKEGNEEGKRVERFINRVEGRSKSKKEGKEGKKGKKRKERKRGKIPKIGREEEGNRSPCYIVDLTA